MTYEYVEEREGGLYIPGSRISLASMIISFQEGASPETIRQNYPSLSLAQIYGAIAFYLNHHSEAEAYLVNLQDKWNALERTAHAPPPEMQERLEAARQRLLAKR